MENARKLPVSSADDTDAATGPRAGRLSFLDLSKLVHQDAGGIRLVYVHPDMPDTVIKVFRPEGVDQFGRFKNQTLLRYRRPLGIYRVFCRELNQYLNLCRRGFNDRRSTFPMATPFGFLPTSEGLALVSEKIKDSSGGMGPSLKSLIKTGKVRAKHVAALNAFFNECIELHIIIGDPNPGNMVYTEERSGRPEFVLVDGVGEKNLIPIRSLSWHYNRYKLEKSRRELLATMAQSDANLPIARPALA